MNEPNVGNAVMAAASNPKVATAVAAGTASTGIAAQMDIITGIVAQISVWLGACTAAVVLAIQLVKLARIWRAWRDEKPYPEEM